MLRLFKLLKFKIIYYMLFKPGLSNDMKQNSVGVWKRWSICIKILLIIIKLWFTLLKYIKYLIILYLPIK